MYGVVRFAEAAQELGVPTVYGAELSLGLSAPQNGVPDPEGDHLLVLARDPDGYRAISRAITEGQMHTHGEKGRPVYDAERVAATLGGHVQVLTGCRKGSVRRALAAEGAVGAARELDRLVALFGAENIAVELTDQGLPDDTERNAALAGLAAGADRGRGLRTVATTGAHYATPDRARLAAALAAVRARRSLDDAEGWLPPGPAHLRSGAEMAERFARHPAGRRPRRGAGPRVRVLPRPAGARAAPVRGARRRDRGELAAPADVDGGRAALRRPDALAAGVRGDRARARGHREAGLPRLLPHRRRHREVLLRS